MPKTFICDKCEKVYHSSRGLRDHYSKNNGHRIAEVRAGNNVSPAKHHVERFLGVAERFRVSRIKELLNILTVEDVHEYVLPSISKRVSLYDVLLTQNSPSVSGNQNENLLKKTLLSFFEEVNKTYEKELEYVLNCLGYCRTTEKFTQCRPLSTASQSRPTIRPMSSFQNLGNAATPLKPIPVSNFLNLSGNPIVATGVLQPWRRRNILPFINDLSAENTPSLSGELSQISNDNLLKAAIKQLGEKSLKPFAKISADIVIHLDISRRDYHLILRTSVGKQIEDIIGFNPFVSKVLMEESLKEKSESLKSHFDLQFSEWNGTVVGFTDVQKSLEWILSKKSLQDIVRVSKNSIIVYFYVDLFPWMAWSRYFSGETTIRMKILEPTNTLSAIATVAAWLGPDTSEYVTNLGKHVFNQIQTLTHVNHPILKSKIKVNFRGLADGAQRRSILGCSSASSSYPIPEGFEHRTQMGDLSVFQEKPIITVMDTMNAHEKFQETYSANSTAAKKQERNEFAKANFGLTGRINPTGIDSDLFYPPMMHRVLNCLGSICLRVDVLNKSLMRKESCWLEKIKPFARKIDEKRKCIKFDEIGVHAFFKKHTEILISSKFSGITLEILSTFFRSLESLLPNALAVPKEWTRPQYEVKMRCALGCGMAFIFGKSLVTPAMRQLMVYTGHYIDQAKKDAEPYWTAM